ncbi:hypothetical protein Ae201684P_003047 [Aphanomyces euteiches]|nr:hypothetical protein Ae201684P_003047 [Aphanomyces euteiches]
MGWKSVTQSVCASSHSLFEDGSARPRIRLCATRERRRLSDAHQPRCDRWHATWTHEQRLVHLWPVRTTPGDSPNGATGADGLAADVSRKQRHNLREQRRIMRIGNQFEQLKKKLESVGFLSNKKDKHSILQATIEYIAALERDSHAAGLPPPLPRPSSSSDSGKENMNSNNHAIESMPPPTNYTPPPPPAVNYMWNIPPSQSVQCVPEMVIDSTATYRHVFLHTSVPCVLTRLDGSIVESNYLFHELFNASPDELRLYNLYSLCLPADVPKLQGIVSKVLSFEVNSCRASMMWKYGVERHVYVSVALVRDHTGQAVNLQCSVWPLA